MGLVYDGKDLSCILELRSGQADVREIELDKTRTSRGMIDDAD